MKVFRFCSWIFYFKDYMIRTQNFVQKTKFYHFWWLAPENSKNHVFTQKLVWIKGKNSDLEFLYDLASKIRKEYQETHLSNKTYCRHKMLISAEKAMICCLITIFKKKALQDLPLDGSATFLSLVVHNFWNFIRKEQFHVMSI